MSGRAVSIVASDRIGCRCVPDASATRQRFRRFFLRPSLCSGGGRLAFGLEGKHVFAGISQGAGIPSQWQFCGSGAFLTPRASSVARPFAPAAPLSACCPPRSGGAAAARSFRPPSSACRPPRFCRQTGLFPRLSKAAFGAGWRLRFFRWRSVRFFSSAWPVVPLMLK